MKGKFIIDCYNNGIKGWFHILPVNDQEAIPLLEQYEMAKRRYGNLFTNIFPYNNSWWCIVKAETVLDAMTIFRDIYKKEVYSKAFEEGEAEERYKDCFQSKSNEKPCSSQQDQVEGDAKAFQEVATAFQLGLSFGFIDGLKENNKPYETAINAHWIDNHNGTISCSHCHTWFNKDDRYYYMRYCPYCNVKMTESEVKENYEN